MGWLIALAVVLGLVLIVAVLPLGLSLNYDSGGMVVRVIFGFLKLRIYPKKKKVSDEEPSETKEKTPKPKGKKKGGPLSDFIPLAKLVLAFLDELRRKLRLRQLYVNLVLGGGDPCDLGINYGRACAAMGCVWPMLEEYFVIKKRDVKIQCDFEAEKTLITVRLDAVLPVWQAISLVGRYGYQGFKEYTNIKNKREGGATP